MATRQETPSRPVSRRASGIRPVWIAAAALAIIALATFAAGMIVMALLLLGGARVPSNVTAAGVAIGGLSPDSARRAIEDQLAAFEITFADGSRTWTLPAAQFGIRPDSEYLVASARSRGAGADIPAAFTVDLNQAQAGLIELGDMAYVEAGVGQPGRALEIPVMLDRFRTAVSDEIADGTVELAMIDLPALEGPTAVNYNGVTSTHVVEAGEELGLIARSYNVALADLISMNGIADPNLIYPGQELIVPAAGLYEPSAADAPPAPTSTGRSIVVSLSEQRIYAYENGQMVHSHLVSTGLPATPTVQGDFAVYVKYQATDMSGPDYYLPQVPYTMYFYEGYGIHGTYWHNNFGRPMSHGCVNLPTDEAAWFFDFASVGTPVRVIA